MQQDKKNNFFEKIKKIKLSKKVIISGIIILALSSGGFFFWRSRQEKTAVAKTETLITASIKDLKETVEVSGTVSNANYTEVTTQAIGTVIEVYVKENQTIKAGDKLFELELSPEGKEAYQNAYASYLSAKTNLASAENKLNSLQISLFEKNQYFINHADAEDLAEDDPTYIQQWAAWKAAENDYKNQANVISQAKAQVSSAYQTYQNMSATVTAPVAGTIENITAVPGLVFGSVNTSGSGTSLSSRMATIKTSNNLLVTFSLSSSDIAKIIIGQKVTLSDNELVGEIVSVDRYGTTGTTTSYTVIAQFDSESTGAADLLPNMTVDGEIAISEQLNALTIPTLAISTNDNSESIVKVKNGTQTETKVVTIGVTSGNLTQILSGLNEGEQVVFELNSFSSSTTTQRNNMSGAGMMMSSGGGGMPGGGMR